VEIHGSARKHGISDDDIHGRLLEIVVVLLDNGTELAIHAMKARPQYLDLLP